MTDINGEELKRGDLVYIVVGGGLCPVIINTITGASVRYFSLSKHGLNVADYKVNKIVTTYTTSSGQVRNHRVITEHMNNPRSSRIVKVDPNALFEDRYKEYYGKIINVLNGKG